jgi:small subunit ribosomal protein S1
MVKKYHQGYRKEVTTEPPAVDESWWESVLAEERFKGDSLLDQHPSSEEGSSTADGLRLSTENKEYIDWVFAQSLFQDDQVVQLSVSGCNRGGLLVNGENLQGFVPISHLVDFASDTPFQEQENLLNNYVNRLLRLKVIECDPQRGRVVFSERAALADSGVRNTLFTRLKVGECVNGEVTNVTEFGAFIDLGGVEGLVHVSEISWGRVRHPSDVVKVGDLVRAYVLNIDPSRGRIALSLKRLCPNPWETAHERYFPGQITGATITSIVPYGAFARLEEGLDGLIHITEINPAEDKQPFQNLAEGQQVQVRVLHVDAVKQRLGLSLFTEISDTGESQQNDV